MKKNKISNKKLQLIKRADWLIYCQGGGWATSLQDINKLLSMCRNRVERKYMKHVLRCGEFFEDRFYFPSTEECMERKLKKAPLKVLYQCDYE